MIKIDKSNPEFNSIPASLEGEILVKQDGHGVLTVSEKTVHFIKQATPEQRIRMGWGEFEDDILAFNTDTVVTPSEGVYRTELANMLDELGDLLTQERVASLRSQVSGAVSIDTLMGLRHNLDDILIEEDVVDHFQDRIKFKRYRATKV